MLQNLDDLFFFAQVVDHHGFAPAGRALGITTSKLSRRIALLEEHLGVRLIQRSTRRFSVTEIGQGYYQHCKAMLVEAEAAQEFIEMSRAEPQGIVRLTCPIALLHANVGVMVADFMAENPRVSVLLTATNRRIDVIGEGVDVAIRVRPPPLQDSELVMRVLGERLWSLVASPTFLEQHNVPKTPSDLIGLPSLGLGSHLAEHIWQLDGPDGASMAVRHTPRLVTDDMIALKLAAIAGVGIVELPTMMMADEIRDGKLVKLIPDWASKGGVIHAVFPSRRGLLPSVRKLIDFLAMRFAEIEEVVQ
ncbi:LysR family transcriptional regulator [Glaciimonas soli]|uniref:LysR family transcriptional regulator n=1 Tax=Glaciimonas soli TaxID=2590999 RepID=A0A843YMS5_9BURK|nr:LysR family transcriptional regulator [Glaciimonas soli]MQQ99276.1 LysR family transcriptional regulator [Glaciimonas soli]